MVSFTSFIHRVSFWILLAFVSSFVIRLILLLDPNKRVYNHTPGPCRVLSSKYKGTSGVHLVTSQNRAYITYGHGKAYGLKTRAGIAYYEIKKVDHSQQQQQQQQQNMYDLVEMKINWSIPDKKEANFAPSGLSSYTSSGGRVLLYVINSHPKSQCIHFFSVDKNTLNHRKVVCDPRFTSLRDITVVGADRFLFTNMVYFASGKLQTIELATQSDFGSVYYYDGHDISLALPRFPSPSPIFFDSERNLLYVGSLLNEIIRVYSVGKDISLTLKTEISLLTSPVGLHIDKKSGEIWVACHPVMFQSFLHYQHPEEDNMRSPSQVLRVRVQEDGVSWVVTEPYANDGATIAASSGVVYHNEQLLIGSAFGRLLHCDVLNPQIT